MAVSEPTYGNWRRPTTPGVGGLGMLATLVLMAGMILAVLAALIAPTLGLVVAVTLGVGLLPLLIKDRHGRTAMHRMTARLSWARTKRAGWHLYHGGPLSRTHEGVCRLPGLAAASRLHEARDSYDRPFAMLEMPSVGHYSVVLECAADGASLVDPDQIDTWVAYWGEWLASLGSEPSLVAASVTVETAPDPGTRLGQEVTSHLTPQAPALARHVLDDIVATYPAGSAQVSTRIALTYTATPPTGGKRRTAERMAREIGTRLPGLSSALAMTGAGAARPMSAVQLCEAIRIAYDPAAHPLIEQAHQQGGSGLTWDDAGPASHQEGWDHYVHDSGVSITWAMADAPRGEVYSSVLTQLINPHPDILRKRVTLLYRPHDAAAAARIVERDKRDARFKVGGMATPERDAVAVAAATQSAREEARGAGVTRFAMLVSATVRSAAELELAAAAIDSLAPTARLRLRRCHGQAAAFAACLPLGLVIPAHLQIPQAVRDLM
ncbi:SCO6880 family protein [Nonomuraea sp. NPDC003707]